MLKDKTEWLYSVMILKLYSCLPGSMKKWNTMQWNTKYYSTLNLILFDNNFYYQK